jgi:hypothetical protein
MLTDSVISGLSSDTRRKFGKRPIDWNVGYIAEFGLLWLLSQRVSEMVIFHSRFSHLQTSPGHLLSPDHQAQDHWIFSFRNPLCYASISSSIAARFLFRLVWCSSVAGLVLSRDLKIIQVQNIDSDCFCIHRSFLARIQKKLHEDYACPGWLRPRQNILAKEFAIRVGCTFKESRRWILVWETEPPKFPIRVDSQAYVKDLSQAWKCG